VCSLLTRSSTRTAEKRGKIEKPGKEKKGEKTWQAMCPGSAVKLVKFRRKITSSFSSWPEKWPQNHKFCPFCLHLQRRTSDAKSQKIAAKSQKISSS